MASIPTQHKPRHRCADLLLSSGLAARAEIWGKPPPGVTTQECKHPWPAQDDLPHAHARHARCAGTNRAVLRQLSPLAAGIYIILMPELYILGYVYGVHACPSPLRARLKGAAPPGPLCFLFFVSPPPPAPSGAPGPPLTQKSISLGLVIDTKKSGYTLGSHQIRVLQMAESLLVEALCGTPEAV